MTATESRVINPRDFARVFLRFHWESCAMAIRERLDARKSTNSDCRGNVSAGRLDGHRPNKTERSRVYNSTAHPIEVIALMVGQETWSGESGRAGERAVRGRRSSSARPAERHIRYLGAQWPTSPMTSGVGLARR